MNFISCVSFKTRMGHSFKKYIKLHYDGLCLSHKAFGIYLWNIFKMSKLMLNHDLPQRQSHTANQQWSQDCKPGPHSQAKIQRSGCVDNFLRIFQFCVISAGIYCNQQKPNVADLAKKEENGSMEAVRRKLKYPPRARPETRRVSGK